MILKKIHLVVPETDYQFEQLKDEIDLYIDNRQYDIEDLIEYPELTYEIKNLWKYKNYEKLEELKEQLKLDYNFDYLLVEKSNNRMKFLTGDDLNTITLADFYAKLAEEFQEKKNIKTK
ncbi:hypothetical protein [Mycoplasma capricolum]|uniref:Uncharacterized protein n=1 Tax=Mycoplasma capricolum subsp. capripneumoniae 87001 TaxID=1124992 RepID=A0A9N7G9F8_MYCCC|nr:hypothetical protein [Mycoplasma capricolum]AJK51323.1 hypothetical protein MCCG_0346 [Mycoplasma capricolum subsp. capripneumoniae 87001]UVO25072.1 hypothetical protein zly1402F_01695 [Mycoplasma capricolum subsp. capripneumoniae]WGD32842.1 hypothetical protein Mccp14020TZ_03480 [Mycoplasma capricolum subsp. capripneumoniae]CDZ18137.1 conserved protein of unknown function [Mycoplasma capricolum subsp. capripneumoniae]